MNDRDCENCKHHTEKGCDSWDCKFERKVTRKETIKVFENMKKGIYPYDPNVYLDIAINSLEIDERYELEYEQIEPCDDAISRQAVLDAIENDNRNGHYSCFASNNDAQCFKGVIGELPSVNPQEPFMNKPCVAHRVCHEDKVKVLDKIRAEIAEYGSIRVTYAITDKTKTDKGIEKLVSGVLNQAKEQVLNVIDKYIAESEGEHG